MSKKFKKNRGQLWLTAIHEDEVMSLNMPGLKL